MRYVYDVCYIYIAINDHNYVSIQTEYVYISSTSVCNICIYHISFIPSFSTTNCSFSVICLGILGRIHLQSLPFGVGTEPAGKPGFPAPPPRQI